MRIRSIRSPKTGRSIQTDCGAAGGGGGAKVAIALLAKRAPFDSSQDRLRGSLNALRPRSLARRSARARGPRTGGAA
eukprot:11854482-Alexandrium_andersonii.AAC.1